MAKTILGSVAKIATKQAIDKVARNVSAPAKSSNPIPAMAIGLATSFLAKRLLPVKIAGIGGVVIAAALTKLLLDRKEGQEGNTATAKSLAKLPRVRKAITKKAPLKKS
jgi:hypothetical protein